jgi:putative phosphoesterase
VNELLIGVISDTHGLLRPGVVEQLRSCGMILHAGDVGDHGLLAQLRAIAPTVAVKGNTDPWSLGLKETEYVAAGGKNFYLLHNIGLLDIEPAAAKMDVVVFGHSHQPLIKSSDGVLYLNPGSAGPKRFKLPVSMALVRITDSGIEPKLIELE